MGGTTLFVVVTVLLIIIIIWCVKLSYNKMANHTDNISLRVTSDIVELESKLITEKFEEKNDNTATTAKGKTDEDRSQPTKSMPHYNTALENLTTKTGNICIKPWDHDYDCVLDHSAQHSNINSTQTQYLSLYHTDPDATIKMDSNPSYGLVMQNTKTSNAVVENDYDCIDDDSCDNPLHLDTTAVGNNHRKSLLTKKKNMHSADQNPVTTSNLQYCSVTTEPSIDVDNTEYGVVNQPKSDYIFSSSPPGGKISEGKYGVANQPKNDTFSEATRKLAYVPVYGVVN